jgi:hypothetical protein
MGTFPQVPPFKILKIEIFNLVGDFYIYETDEFKGSTWGNVPYNYKSDFGALKSKEGFDFNPHGIRNGIKRRQKDQGKEG